MNRKLAENFGILASIYAKQGKLELAYTRAKLAAHHAKRIDKD